MVDSDRSRLFGARPPVCSLSIPAAADRAGISSLPLGWSFEAWITDDAATAEVDARRSPVAAALLLPVGPGPERGGGFPVAAALLLPVGPGPERGGGFPVAAALLLPVGP
ncbi:hypothetical protein, partial [Kocuria sp. NPDC057446]|uniref:hypothetical protein n=1 Tax=Kocuria sp. NPDC057446 TaxID=3346137 RepID=UPI0036BE8338